MPNKRIVARRNLGAHLFQGQTQLFSHSIFLEITVYMMPHITNGNTFDRSKDCNRVSVLYRIISLNVTDKSASASNKFNT